MADTARFERWSRQYERSRLQGFFFDRVHRAALDAAAQLPEPEVVLDVGCGTGRLLRAARTRWPRARLIGVDPAGGMIEVARRLDEGITFQVAPAERLPLPDASVDLAFSTASFHHWHDRSAGVREVARVLRPAGHFILADQSAPALFAWLLGDRRYLSPGERRELLASVGLRVLRHDRSLSRFLPITVARADASSARPSA